MNRILPSGPLLLELRHGTILTYSFYQLSTDLILFTVPPLLPAASIPPPRNTSPPNPTVVEIPTVIPTLQKMVAVVLKSIVLLNQNTTNLLANPTKLIETKMLIEEVEVANRKLSRPPVTLWPRVLLRMMLLLLLLPDLEAKMRRKKRTTRICG